MLADVIFYVLLGGGVLMVGCWVGAMVVGHLLLWDFVRRYREVAVREIPWAELPLAHPRKATFFLSRRFRVLAAGDAKLEGLRWWYVRLLGGGVAMFFGLGVLTCVVGVSVWMEWL